MDFVIVSQILVYLLCPYHVPGTIVDTVKKKMPCSHETYILVQVNINRLKDRKSKMDHFLCYVRGLAEFYDKVTFDRKLKHAEK